MQAGEDHPQTWQRGLAAGLLGAFAAASLATAAPCHAAATPFLSSTGKHARQLAMHVPQHHPVCFADTDASWLGGRSTHACGATTVSAGAKGPLVEEEARLFRLRQEVEGEAREELNRKRMQLEDEARWVEGGCNRHTAPDSSVCVVLLQPVCKLPRMPHLISLAWASYTLGQSFQSPGNEGGPPVGCHAQVVVRGEAVRDALRRRRGRHHRGHRHHGRPCRRCAAP